MKKTIISFFALLLVAQFTWAAAVTPPADIPAYWASANGNSGVSLWSAIGTQTRVGFGTLGYNGLWSAYQKTDVYPADSLGKAGKIWDMYGECDFTYETDECHGDGYQNECDCYNREHSIPKSWFGGGTSGIGCDIFHLVPTDGKINGTRSNDEFGEVAGAKNYYGNGTGSAGSWSTDRPTIASTAGEVIQGSGKVFEPKDQYKGDFARGYMGTIIKWQLAGMTSGNDFFTGSYTPAGYFGFTKKAVVLMMKWHREDPVSQKEIDRNNGIQQTQGNRNPFIDYPYLAEYIWGEHAGEAVDMSLLMPSTDPNFIPGVSNGWRGGDTPPTPPTPVTKYGVTWSANGIETSVDSVAENSKISVLPATPVSCSSESPIFMGWTIAPISGFSDEEPAELYTKPADFPAVTEDVTYYAVFAHAEIVEYGPQLGEVTFTFTTTVTTVEDDGVTVTFAQGSNTNNAPKYYESGASLRCYGGNTITVTADGITKVVFAFGTGGNSNAILANVGTFETDTWTGNADEVIFTIDGSSGHRRFTGMTVTRNGSGEGTIYSRYITACQDPTEVVEIRIPDASAQKILIGGQIYILREGVVYTLTGSRVK